MQSVPTTLLSSETGLGKTPLLIVSQNMSDGAYLSLLISNHLQPNVNDSYFDRPLTTTDNYFINESIKRCTTEPIEQRQAQNDLYAKLHLLLDEGFDTNKLFGLLLPIHAFYASAVKLHFEYAKCVFIFNDLELLEDHKSHNFNEVIDFIKTNSINCFVLHAKFLSSNPEFVLGQLSSFISSTLRNKETILPHTTLPLSLFTSENHRNLPNEITHSFFNIDTITNKYTWLAGNDLLFIAYNLSASKKDILLQKIKELYACFAHLPSCILLCEDDDTVNFYDTLLDEFEIFARSTTCINQQNSLSQQLNVIITQHEKPYYFVDDLSTNFSYAQCLHNETSPQKSVLAFSKVSSEISNRHAGLAEVLLKDYPESNLFFSRQAWIELNELDTRIDNHYVLWDFAIQVLEKYHHHALVYPAAFYNETGISSTPEFDQKESTAYQAVLIKHRPSLETCLDEVIKIASHENLISHKEKISLYEKIATQQIISSHAKEELKSLQLLTSQLHLRIHYLENNWYQKFSSKISRFKKIFFKKKSPGTGSLKRILQFIRFSFSKAGFGIFRKVVANVFKHLYLLAEKREVEIILKGATNNKDIFTYHDWIQKKLNQISLQNEYETNKASYTNKPIISIIMPVYNAPIKYLKAAIESVINQLYPYWELCIADDCSTNKKIQKLLHVYSVKDPRIKIHYRTQNGHISATSNDALALASGAYILLMDHDDLITTNCLWEVVKTLNEKPQAEIIYSDEDKIDEQSYHRDAHFKPDWAPDHLLSRNYIGHVCVLKKTLIDSIGGFRLGFEGSQDYDLMLRATEQTQNIAHIPKVLYHWRIHQLSAAQSEEVKPYAYIAAKKALEEALTRRAIHGNVKYLSGLRGYKIEYALQQNDLVSIIIPTKDQTALLKNTIDSILSITGYQNFEIIVLNNNSSSKEFYDWCNEYTKKYSDRLRVIESHFPFNFSKLMNMGAKLAKGDHLLMLNNDVEIIHANWLEIMLSYAQQNRIGAVGAKLLYPDDTIQHAGVIIGLGGIAGHSFVGAYKDEAGYFNYIQSVNNYSAVTAACLLCRKEVFHAVGGMDETFEVEYNDVDFCLKLLEAGYDNVYLPQVELYHYESATRGHPHQSKPSYERHLKEMKLFTNKWQHMIDHDPFYNQNLNLGAHDFSMNFSA